MIPVYNRLFVPPERTLQAIIDRLGLGQSLRFCLDAGDPRSYRVAGSQTWEDTSPNAENFTLGVDNTVTASDPTYIGSLPPRADDSHYWSFDGGDVFRQAQAAQSWQQTWHKDAAIFSLLMVYWPIDANPGTLWANGFNNNAQVSSVVEGSGSSRLRFMINTGGGAGTNQVVTNPTATYQLGRWNYHFISLNEANATGRIFTNQIIDTFTSTYTSPSASDHAQRFSLGGNLSGTSLFGPFDATSRIACAAAWNVELTDSEGEMIRNALAPRFYWN